MGDPAEILPPEAHDKIWAIQKPLDFPREVFGLTRDMPNDEFMREMTQRYTRSLRRHAQDRIL